MVKFVTLKFKNGAMKPLKREESHLVLTRSRKRTWPWLPLICVISFRPDLSTIREWIYYGSSTILIYISSLVNEGGDQWLSPEQRLDNALLAINLSRKIGAKIYASPMDLVEGKQKMILTIFVGLMSKSFENGNSNGTNLDESFPPIPDAKL